MSRHEICPMIKGHSDTVGKRSGLYFVGNKGCLCRMVDATIPVHQAAVDSGLLRDKSAFESLILTSIRLLRHAQH